MDARTLQTRLAAPQPPLLLHVLPGEVFAAQRLPGSCHACVYEMTFLDQVKNAGAAPDREIVLYGAGEGSRDAETARAKLAAAGYTRVEIFPGGLAEWQAAGLPLEGAGSLPSTPDAEGTFRVNTTDSVVRWTGRNLFNHHHGTVRLSGGELAIRAGALTAARFEIDLRTIRNEDLEDREKNALLIAHLQSDDFFDTAHFPTAEFVAETAEPIANATPGTPNYRLKGRFTLRGITHPLEFPIVAAAQSPTRVTGQAQFELDRTAYGSLYGSGKFFRFLGQHVVNDRIHLHVTIHADQAA